MIDLDRLIAETFLRGVEWYDEIGSTNDRAKELASDSSVALPCLVGATCQTAGRGRGANRWWSGDGTLMVSVLFDMPALGLSQRHWPQFSLVTGLAVAEALEAFLPHAIIGLKWPNDVWLAGRKVCGILIEQPERSPGRLVVGLGINVNTSFADAPDELRAIATSMRDHAGHSFPLEEVLVRFVQRWEANIASQAAENFNLTERWERFCVLRHRVVRVERDGATQVRLCRGIAEDGALLVDDNAGTQRCYAGTVRLVE